MLPFLAADAVTPTAASNPDGQDSKRAPLPRNAIVRGAPAISAPSIRSSTRALPNCRYRTTAHRAVAVAPPGRIDEARRSVAELLRKMPDFSRAFSRQRLFDLKDPRRIELNIDGLQRAAVPAG